MSLSRLLLVKASRLSRRRAMTENCNWKIRTGKLLLERQQQQRNSIIKFWGEFDEFQWHWLLLQKLIASHDSVARTNASSPANAENSYTIIHTRVANIPNKSL